VTITRIRRNQIAVYIAGMHAELLVDVVAMGFGRPLGHLEVGCDGSATMAGDYEEQDLSFSVRQGI